MNRRNAYTIFGIVAAGVFVASIFFLSSSATASSCGTLSYLERVPCYMKEVQREIDGKDINAGFEYAKKTREKVDYTLNHFIMHEIGREAYDIERGNIASALTFAKERESQGEFDYELDGYRHGLFEAYFTDKGTRSVETLAADICPTYITLDTDDYDTVATDAFQCFHGIGHGLMYANYNDVQLSLSQCDQMPQKWQRNWCYYGVFMQYTYLYWPGNEAEKPEITNYDAPMNALCDELPERQQNACYRLVGRGYLGANFLRGDRGFIKGAFTTCEAAPKQHQENCIIETAAFALPIPYASDLRNMFNMCSSVVPPIYTGACVFGAASGVRQGTGGFHIDIKNLCTFVDTSFVENCNNAKGRGYTNF